jgi:hypothetical protein
VGPGDEVTERYCSAPGCGKLLVRLPKEFPSRFLRRKTCLGACANQAQAASLRGKFGVKIGQRIGKFTIVAEAGRLLRAPWAMTWWCQYDCGHRVRMLTGVALSQGARGRACGQCSGHFIEYQGRKQSMTRWAKEFGISYQTLSRRMTVRHETFEQAITPRVNPHLVLIEYNGKTKSMVAWARELGITREAVRVRLKAGWPPELAVTAIKGEVHRRACSRCGYSGHNRRTCKTTSCSGGDAPR